MMIFISWLNYKLCKFFEGVGEGGWILEHPAQGPAINREDEWKTVSALRF